MRRSIICLIALFVVINMAGCAGLQKKFTRKKKEPVKMPHIYQVKKFEKKPTPELYKKHYSYFVTWQSELAQVLGKNHKKDVRCIEEMTGNLNDMHNMLSAEKADKLKPHIDRLAKVRDIILNEEISQYNKAYAQQTIDREGRFIKREFVYGKIKDYLKKGFEDEPKDAGSGDAE